MSALAALLLALAAVVCVGKPPAQSSPPPIDPELRARFGFLGPTIHKVGFGIDLLRVAQLDGEGGADIVVHNGRRGRLEILSLVAGAVFARSESVPGNVRGLQIADVDGNGAGDVVLVTDRGRLAVRLANGRRLPEIEIGQPAPDCLRTGDLDGDGLADVVVLTGDGLRVVRRLMAGAVVSPPVPLGEERVMSFRLFDVNADRQLDVVLATSASRMPLRVKLGGGDGEFGEWILMDVPGLQNMFPGTGALETPTMATIEGAHNRVVEYRLRNASAGGTAQLLTTLPPLTRSSSFPFAHGDVDNDGDRDLVIAHPEHAQLTFLLEDNGRFRTVTAPSLAGISSVALGDLDADGLVDLVLASSEEEALAWKSGAVPLGTFPARIPVPGQPSSVAISNHSVFALTRSGRQGTLYQVRREDGVFAEAQPLVQTGRLNSDPLRLLVADLQDGEGDEVALVVPGIGLQTLLRDGVGGFLEPDPDASAGFTRRMDDGALSLVRHEGRDALMIVRSQFARVFRLDQDGEPSILHQDNGPSGSTELTLGAVMDDGSRLFLDKGNKLYRLAQGQAPMSVDVAQIAATHLLAHGDSALLIGSRGVLRVPFGSSYGVVPQRSHEPPTDDTDYWSGLSADLDGDGRDELALLDQDIHGVHVLVATPGDLQRALSFPVFEEREDMPPTYEPREIAAGDVDGDGRVDLVLIAHDRVLIYIQEK